MAEVTYQCVVNKVHTRKVPDYSKAAPICCGMPMTRMQAAQSQTPSNAPKKPQARGNLLP